MLAGLLTTTAFARASDYLGGYGVWATAKSDGVVRIHADVEAVRTSDEVGVSYITVQESRDGGDTWTTLETFTKEDLGMYDEDTPVSYTHLDVYKRQAWGPTVSMTAPPGKRGTAGAMPGGRR